MDPVPHGAGVELAGRLPEHRIGEVAELLVGDDEDVGGTLEHPDSSHDFPHASVE